MALRHPLRHPGTGGKPDQAAQGATGLRPDRLSLVSRKSGPPRVAHRRLLADADGARGHPQTPAARYGRITTLRMRLIKVAGRVRIAFAAACPEAALCAGIARGLQPAGP